METRNGVAEAKHTIDGMRTTRDTQMSQMSALKLQLREQNQRLLLVSQEKVRMEAKNRMNAANPSNPASNYQCLHLFTVIKVKICFLKSKFLFFKLRNCQN